MTTFYSIVFALIAAMGCYASVPTNKQEKRELNTEIPLKFIFLGDWGAQEEIPKERRLQEIPTSSTSESPHSFKFWNEKVAYAMSNYASLNAPSFLVSLGDNFYNNGVSSVTDSLWKTLYQEVYNYDSLQIPWYVTLGNHDYGTSKALGNVQAQLDYTIQAIDNRWNMDSHCYSKTWTLEGSEDTLQIVFIDTSLIAPEEAYVTSSEAVSKEVQESKKTAQLNCLEGHLASSYATWLLVAGHYPLYSSGQNSPGDLWSMVQALESLFLKHQVDAYLCGHDHILEHLNYKYEADASGDQHNIDFFISGAGAKPDKEFAEDASAATSLFRAATGGFASASVTSTSMMVHLWDAEGKQLYAFSRQQRRTVNGTSTKGMKRASLTSPATVLGNAVVESEAEEITVWVLEFLAAGIFAGLVLMAAYMISRSSPVASLVAPGPSEALSQVPAAPTDSSKSTVSSASASGSAQSQDRSRDRSRPWERWRGERRWDMDSSRDSVNSSTHALLAMRSLHDDLERAGGQ